MVWVIQFTDSAKTQMASLGWEDAAMVEKTLRELVQGDPLGLGVATDVSGERRRLITPPVQVVAWVARSVETLTVVEVIFPDLLADPEPDNSPVVPSRVVRRLGTPVEESVELPV